MIININGCMVKISLSYLKTEDNYLFTVPIFPFIVLKGKNAVSLLEIGLQDLETALENTSKATRSLATKQN